ncbi:hypothetical protein ABZX40_07410 [Streptomyces sp. NPDC004610]|uniref:hypothetical protein n=1 Tax=unclassified Streptomyces TaxID=2593676 RepID=UPI0033A2D994
MRRQESAPAGVVPLARRPPGLSTAGRTGLEHLDWWRPRSVRFVENDPPGSALSAFLESLRTTFEDGGHHVVGHAAASATDLALAVVRVPEGSAPLSERVEEAPMPLLLRMRRTHGALGNIAHSVAVVEVPERMSTMSHAEAVHTGRVLMARLGAPKVVVVTVDATTDRVIEATLCTMEGGHPSETENTKNTEKTENTDSIAQGICDRLVAAACTREVAGRYDVESGAITAAQWADTSVPEALAAAGRRMGGLRLLPAPHRLTHYVSPRLAAVYERYLGMKAFSEGMLFAFDPGLGALVVTASGSWEVDKRALRRDDVTVVAHRLDNGRLRVLAPVSVSPKGPSVEAWEVCALLEAVPTVRIRQDEDGAWIWDPHGTHEVPAIRAGLHAHVGVSAADPSRIETVPADRERYPYGFGCGTDLMIEVAQDTVRRSQAINDPDDPRHFVRWPMLYHGEMAVELWGPDQRTEPLSGLLDLFDTQAEAAITYDPDHIEQPW